MIWIHVVATMPPTTMYTVIRMPMTMTESQYGKPSKSPTSAPEPLSCAIM